MKTLFRILRRTLMGIFIAALIVAALVGVYLGWFLTRPQPAPVTDQSLFSGVYYSRAIHTDPRPYIAHIVRIDLAAAGVSFLVTPADDLQGFDYRARTPSEFLTEFGVQLAVNGDFFDPWRDFGPWNYYPHSGDGVNARGFTASLGTPVTEGYAPPENFATLYISADNTVSFNQPSGELYNAISGHTLMREGEYHAVWNDTSYVTRPQPRTAVGLDAAGTTLYLVVVDGRQPNYSEGITMQELSDILHNAGAHNAINLDGGGSATLVIQNADGSPQVLNSPMHSSIPGNERPAANHLGIFALPASDN